jgi:hypothetical protein
MVSLVTIPVELVLDIVAYTVDGDLMLPVVGRDAVWAVPPESQVIWKQVPPRPLPQEPNEDNGEETSEIPVVSRKRPHSTLKALRR